MALARIKLTDDSQELPSSEAYLVLRVFGKATLILPYLAIGEYLQARERYLDRNGVSPDAAMLRRQDKLDAMPSRSYMLVKSDNRGMTVMGRKSELAKIHDQLASKSQFTLSTYN
ncbi:hypothetical protein AB1K70_15415 [Bremerella sp. JC770]|uniref:hypothetical protein n=1 Tax=Bremerella sp. JC770 TaxID=3232137 RepID=UPI003459AD7A